MNIKYLGIFFLLSLVGCTKNDAINLEDAETTAVFNPNLVYDTMTDQENNTYKTIKIGSQTWMAENLRTTKYNDGSEIPNIADDNEWSILNEGAYCTYKNTTDPVFIVTYGRLYNWYVVISGKLAPVGWHVPSEAEWLTLINYLSSDVPEGFKLKEAGVKHWHESNTGATNESGFTALPGSWRSYIQGSFGIVGGACAFWCSTEAEDPTCGIYFSLMGASDYMSYGLTDKRFGNSIRLVKD